MAENIVDQITDAARRTGEQLLGAAQERYDADFKAGSAAIERDAAEARRRGRRQAEEAIQRELSSARLDQRRKAHTCKRRLLDEVYEQAWQELVTEDNYRAWLEAQLARHARRGDLIMVAARERERFAGDLSGLLQAHGVRLSDEVGRFRAGFVIDRGATRLNCSLNEEFRALAVDTEVEISGVLFP